METTTTQSLELFITALLGQNYSPKTLRAYSDDLRQFIQWVEENRGYTLPSFVEVAAMVTAADRLTIRQINHGDNALKGGWVRSVTVPAFMPSASISQSVIPATRSLSNMDSL
jgi:hypothetical protein